MQPLSELPFCGPALKRLLALAIQPPENRRAFRHESVAPQQIRVAIACPRLTAPLKQRVPRMLSCHRDNQTACQDSLLHNYRGVSVKRRLSINIGGSVTP